MTQRAKARQKAKAAHRPKAPSKAAHGSPGTSTGPPQRRPANNAAAPQGASKDKTPVRGRHTVRRWMWLNGLALVMFTAFAVFAILQSVFGWQVRNDELVQAGQQVQSYWHYLTTGHFAEAIFENWESEFLQMGSYILLTAFLVQRGSPESKPLDQDDRPEDQPENAGPDAPPVSRTHGTTQWLYRNSLSLVLFASFALSFIGHLLGGTAEYNEQQALQTGAAAITAWQFLGTSDFWFQSMQNWQSEFLAVGCLIVLSITLRQHGSPESKAVTAPHAQTGE